MAVTHDNGDLCGNLKGVYWPTSRFTYTSPQLDHSFDRTTSTPDTESDLIRLSRDLIAETSLVFCAFATIIDGQHPVLVVCYELEACDM